MNCPYVTRKQNLIQPPTKCTSEGAKMGVMEKMSGNLEKRGGGTSKQHYCKIKNYGKRWATEKG
jgi:hypothetical protein